MINQDAIVALYPNVAIVIDDTAYDKDGNIFEYDLNLVESKAAELQAEYEANKQAVVAAKQNALNKLMALGLTEEEALSLGLK